MKKYTFNQINNLFLIISCILTILSFSKLALALDPNKAITQYAHDLWQDELPQNTIHSITQTNDGYIWLGTYEGLTRFDGVNFYTFNKDNTDEIKSNAINSLYKDRSGKLWIGTDNGLISFQNGIFTRYSDKDGLVNNTVKCIFEDKNEKIWIGTNEGVSCLEKGKFVNKSITMSNSKTYQIYQDHLDCFWFATEKGLVSLKNDVATIYTTKDGLTDNTILSLCEDNIGNLWIGTDNGLSCFNGGNFTRYNFENILFKRIVSIIQDKQANLWFASVDKGLWRLTDNKFSNFSIKEGLTQNSVRSIYEDTEGSIWIGTNGGLNRLKDSIFNTYTTQEGLSDNNVRAVCESVYGGFWIGTGEGVNYIKDGRVTYYTTKEGLSNNTIKAFFEESNGNLWVGTSGGLNLIKNGKLVNLGPLNDNFKNTSISAIYIDKKANIWVGTSSRGLYLLKSNQVLNYKVEDGLGSNIRAIYEDKDGNLWIATSKGVGLFKNEKIVKEPVMDALSDSPIFVLYQDLSGVLWIGTENGLFWLRNGKLTSCTKKQGLFDNVVFQILESNDESFWMSCNKGIYRVSRKDLLDYEKGIIETVKCVFYNKLSGMTTNQCNGSSQPSGWKDKEGKLWFSTIKGVTVVDPKNIKTNKIKPPVILEQVIVDGESISLSEEVTLEPGKKNFEFYFNGLSFFCPEKVRFKYKLEGFDKNWSNETALRFTSYTNLPSGNYEFKVIACNNDGLWNMEGAKYKFTISIPFWQTYTAYFIYFLTLFGVVLGTIHLQTEKVRQRARKILEREKEEAKLREAELRLEAAEIQAKVVEEENKRHNQELAHARQLQLSLLPKKNIELEKIRIVGQMRTASEVGGDYYDFFKLGEEKYCVVLGDATGHGVASGLVVSMVKSLLVQATSSSLSNHLTSSDLIISLNQA